MIGRVFLDTNVLVYPFDMSEPARREVAISRLNHERELGGLVVSTQVLQELYVALTRGRAPISSPELAEDAVRAATRLAVVQVDPSLVLAAISGARRWQVSFWDALILGAAVSAGCEVVLSEDLNHGQVYGGVRVEDPFREVG